MGIEHTSVPRWPAQPAPWDERARSCSVMGLGAAAEPAVTEWLSQARAAEVPSSSLLTDDLDLALQHVEQDMAQAVVGWRLLVAGPEAGVLKLLSAARARGAVGTELIAHVTGVEVRDLACAHCDAVTPTTASLGDTVGCLGCGRSLHLYHHVSRRLGAYLGFMVDAEDRDPGPLLEDA